MAADPSLDLELLRELLFELVRADVITGPMIERVEHHFEGQAQACRGSDREERYTQLAHMARMLPIEAAGPSQSDWEADRRRKRMRVVSTDGGNDAS